MDLLVLGALWGDKKGGLQIVACSPILSAIFGKYQDSDLISQAVNRFVEVSVDTTRETSYDGYCRWLTMNAVLRLNEVLWRAEAASMN